MPTFKCEEVGVDFLETAPYQIITETVLEAPRDAGEPAAARRPPRRRRRGDAARGGAHDPHARRDAGEPREADPDDHANRRSVPLAYFTVKVPRLDV